MSASQNRQSHEILALDVIPNYNIERVVRRYAIEHDIPLEIAQEHEREMKRFFSLCVLHPDRGYGMYGPIDEFWHTFIVDTELYVAFCDQVFGKYIHHSPGDSHEGRTAYDQFLADYESTFAEEAPHHVWPRNLDAGGGFGCRGPAGCRKRV